MGLFTCISFIQNYVYLIYVRARVGYNMGDHFRHNSHQAAIIILVILYFACVYMLILYNNYVYIIFTAVLVVWGETGARN